ncbi:MAG: methylated-DNA--[protein]-cysteine S-methyltransferase [Gammaproteobacteria bacterium]|nr:methylated-DNA--[protein]-cysteine S-methyltransferase [Gammaproteobacteria bacterium]MDH5730861.1 methylated-DNA--[protein]-cysteine S-methyltransferase [Gammaproteobacteria bacterium]
MSDYERIAKAISFISEQVATQPSLEEISAHLHMSPFHFQRLFCRWAGVTPKRFLQILTVERAKQLLTESKSLLEVSDRVGLSSSSRLYDHFINLEAVTPGDYKKGGAGVTIEYAIHDTPFGLIFIAKTSKGICKLAFLNEHDAASQLQELRCRWPQAETHENYAGTVEIIESIFNKNMKIDRPLSLHVSGTNFQISVWKALLQIPPGSVTSYSQLASHIGKPKAARAVGTAIGANPIAFLIPCHRVIQQSGKLGGYHWGETRMHAIHAWESARFES